jgi:peptidoglycan/xylan/chitin deacetylase (PgdA/CDA1 family)
MLRFLADNGYKTLTADEYVDRQVRGERGQEHEVLLTFDDGHKSLFTVAYPALKRFGLKAVAYIVPGLLPEGDGPSGSSIRDRSLCSWKEIEDMHASGIVDFQSHSMYHHSIPISDRVLDFVRPGLPLCFLESSLAPLSEQNGRTRTGDELRYGTPIHDWGPRFGEALAFRESPAVILACVEEVGGHGGAAYFRIPGWRRRLRAVLAAAQRANPGGSFETAAEQRGALLKDLLDSKREIERRLPGKTVRHFCYPWFRGSAQAVRLSAEAGYVSNAWDSLLPDFVPADSAVLPIPRLLHYYLWRLPGRGRRSLGAVLRMRGSSGRWNRWP